MKKNHNSVVINEVVINSLARAYFGITLNKKQTEIISKKINKNLHNLLAQYIYPEFTEKQDEASENYLAEQFMQTGHITSELIEMGQIKY